jgi:metallo-beta-lactamase family protein
MFSDARNLLCIIGWQAPGSLGDCLLSHETPVLVRHQEGREVQEDWISPALAVKVFHSFSGHADAAGLLAWLGAARGVKQVFLVHGEEEQALALAHSIRSKLGVPVEVPRSGEAFVLSPRKRGAIREPGDSNTDAAGPRAPARVPAADSMYWGEE